LAALVNAEMEEEISHAFQKTFSKSIGIRKRGQLCGTDRWTDLEEEEYDVALRLEAALMEVKVYDAAWQLALQIYKDPSVRQVLGC
jgi:hypothetical protein